MAAPICATSLAGPSRSSRAISEAWRLAGTANAGKERPLRSARAAPSLSASSTAFVISSTNSGMPSVRSMMSCRMFAGSELVAGDAVDHGGDFALSQTIDGERVT